MLLITLTTACSVRSVPESHDSVTVSQHAQYQVTETDEWNSDIINVMIYTCACENDFSERGLLESFKQTIENVGLR